MTDVAIYNAAAVQESLRFGPCMSKLSAQRQRFVLELLSDDRDNGADAAARAGYAPDNRNSQKSIAARLRHDPDVLAAIGEVARSQLFSLRGKAVRTLQFVLDDPNAKPSEKIKAAREVLDRTDMPVKTEAKVTVEHTVPKDLRGQIMELLDLCRQANRNPRPVIGDEYYRKAIELGLIQDAEFAPVEVPPGPGSAVKKGLPIETAQPLTISESMAPSFTGLEDVI